MSDTKKLETAASDAKKQEGFDEQEVTPVLDIRVASRDANLYLMSAVKNLQERVAILESRRKRDEQRIAELENHPAKSPSIIKPAEEKPKAEEKSKADDKSK